LEELINYFHYDYPQPRGDDPFGATVEVASCPWSETHKLVRVGIRAKDLARGERPRANLVFLLDVSGSMEPENKLPLAKRAMRLLLDRLTPHDTVGIVTYAGDAKIALEPVAITADGKQRVTDVLEGLHAGSGTHGSAGIQNAYAMATNHFVKEGVNRVILCTDGDFNIGITDRGELLDLITQEAKSGVFLSVLGFGMDNLKDATMETLADKGNGNYAYIDSFSEARKVLVEQLDGTLVTVAKDAKVQVEFNPARVASYRLLGYEKRLLRDRDFNDDTKDAGEIGAGHSVTVLYEIIPAGPNLAGVDALRYGPKKAELELAGRVDVKPVHTDELLNLKLRYKQPDGDKSRLIEQPVKDADREFAQAGADLKFAAAVAGYGMLLRDSPHKGDLTWDKVLRLAEQGLGDDKEGYRAEFIDLARTAQKLSGGK
jgi:Ca-activated chloride channel family protein